MKNKIYTIVLPVLLTLLCFSSCKIQDSEIREPIGKGYTVSKDVAVVAENYLGMAAVGFAAVVYGQATDDEKVLLKRSDLFWYQFIPVGDIWEVTVYNGGTHYVKVKYGADETVSRIDITRARGYDDEGTPVFDSCYLAHAASGNWQFSVWNTQVKGKYYRQERMGKAELLLDPQLAANGLPDSFLLSGKGDYTSEDHRGDIIDVDWEVSDGLYNCYARQYNDRFLKGVLRIKSGKTTGTKDDIKTVFDRTEKTLAIDVNGVKEMSGWGDF